MTPESLARLQRYAWPGNIRELQNVLERACVLSPGPVVEILEELQVASPSEPAAGPMIARQAGIVTLEENERIHIRQALAASGGRIHGPDGAAALLGINPSTLRSRMKKLGIAKVAA